MPGTICKKRARKGADVESQRNSHVIRAMHASGCLRTLGAVRVRVRVLRELVCTGIHLYLLQSFHGSSPLFGHFQDN